VSRVFPFEKILSERVYSLFTLGRHAPSPEASSLALMRALAGFEFKLRDHENPQDS
jgi:hypothetical protein